jgi:uncharacterized protein YdhG (YjbR/CyaY superfamily)
MEIYNSKRPPIREGAMEGEIMDSSKKTFTTIDEYIATFPEDVQKILQEVRATIKAAAPDAEEKISYAMPAFTLKGNLVYFAAFKKHIGFTDPVWDREFKKSSRFTSRGKVRCSFHWTGQCRST